MSSIRCGHFWFQGRLFGDYFAYSVICVAYLVRHSLIRWWTVAYSVQLSFIQCSFRLFGARRLFGDFRIKHEGILTKSCCFCNALSSFGEQNVVCMNILIFAWMHAHMLDGVFLSWTIMFTMPDSLPYNTLCILFGQVSWAHGPEVLWSICPNYLPFVPCVHDYGFCKLH